jgi:hypothetical protein
VRWRRKPEPKPNDYRALEFDGVKFNYWGEDKMQADLMVMWSEVVFDILAES